MATTEGIDTSDYQTITSIPLNVRFVIRKAGEGLGTDGASRCDSDIALAKRLGRDTAIYWFVHASKDAHQQAALAITAAKRNGVHGIACDCEVTDGLQPAQIAAVMKAFIADVRSAGLSELLYDNLSWVDEFGEERWGYAIWLADPSHASPSRPAVCHQYGTPPVAGIGSQVDVDRWVGDQASYDLFFHGVKPIPAPAPKPVPPPPTPAPKPIPPLPPTPEEPVFVHAIEISTDINGNGFHECVDYPWSSFVAATHEGTTGPGHFADGRAHANQSAAGKVALSVTGAVKNGTAVVLLTATI